MSVASEFTTSNLIQVTGLALPIPLAGLVWFYLSGYYLLAVFAAFSVGLIAGTLLLAYNILDVLNLFSVYREEDA